MVSSLLGACTIRPLRGGSRWRSLVLPGLILVVVGVTFFSAVADPDFFWHLATGRLIVENLALPDHDPFTPFRNLTDREAMILKGYWLAQVVYQLCYAAWGLYGIVHPLSRFWNRAMVGTCAALMGVVFVSALGDGRTLRAGLDPFRYPERAAAFVAAAGVSGNLFCTDVWGSYLLWRLPKVTVLNDTRALSDASNLKTNRITQRTGNLEKNLQALDARNIVPSECDPMSGFLGNLWGRLLTIDDWRLVCADNVALVCFRSDVNYTARPLPRQERIETSLKHALDQTQRTVAMSPHALRHWGELGQVHVMRREKPAAIAVYRQELALEPGNSNYQTMLSMMEVS